MAMPILIPVLIGTALALTMAMGIGKANAASLPPPPPDAKKSVEQAIKKKDWQAAVVTAISSKNVRLVQATIKAFEKLGRTQEARDLKRVLSDWVELDKKSTPKPVLTPRKPAREIKPRELPSTAKAPPSAPRPAAPRPAAPRPAAPRPAAPLTEDQLLLREITGWTRATADRKKLASWQAKNSLTSDGLYGPGSAKFLYSKTNEIPPNPLHWPRTNTMSAVNSYSGFLDSLKPKFPNSLSKIEQLKRTLGQ